MEGRRYVLADERPLVAKGDATHMHVIVIGSQRRPLTFSEFTHKEFGRDKEGNWIDEIPDGNDRIDDMR